MVLLVGMVVGSSTAILISSTPSYLQSGLPKAEALTDIVSPGPFSFGAVGDWGCNGDSQNVVYNIKNHPVDVLLGLGDYSYNTTKACWEQETMNGGAKPYVHDLLHGIDGNPLPWNTMAMGNHENAHDPECLPDPAHCPTDHLNDAGWTDYMNHYFGSTTANKYQSFQFY